MSLQIVIEKDKGENSKEGNYSSTLLFTLGYYPLSSNHLSSFLACQFSQLGLKNLATHVLFILFS